MSKGASRAKFIFVKKALFVCIGNCCRSQMAEAFANYHGKGRLEAHSAGIKPAGYIHPLAIQVMEEIGFSMSQQESKLLDANLLEKMDWVVTLSPDVRALCPSVPPHVREEQWAIDDVVALFVKGEKRVQAFRMVREEIEKNVKELLGKIL